MTHKQIYIVASELQKHFDKFLHKATNGDTIFVVSTDKETVVLFSIKEYEKLCYSQPKK